MVYRKGFVIYFKDKTLISQLDKKRCHVVYYSEKANYAIIYVDSDIEEEFLKKLESNNLVQQISKSEVPYEKYKFEQK